MTMKAEVLVDGLPYRTDGPKGEKVGGLSKGAVYPVAGGPLSDEAGALWWGLLLPEGVRWAREVVAATGAQALSIFEEQPQPVPEPGGGDTTSSLPTGLTGLRAHATALKAYAEAFYNYIFGL